MFSGFNGFGQFNCDDRETTEFKDYTADFLEGNVLTAASWSYNAYAAGSSLLLRGFLSRQTNATVAVSAECAITQLSACDRFCLVLLENGKVFKLLPCLNATLEEVKFDIESLPQPLPPTPTPPPPPPTAQKRTSSGVLVKRAEPPLQLRFAFVACGANITVAISDTNAVYSVPSRIHQFERHLRVRQLQCGFEHALLLCANGDVYGWGNGLRGQLGNRALCTEEAPVLIEALAGIKITFIAAGGWHSAAISAFGDLYTWGCNGHGQMGLRVYKTIETHALKEPTVYLLPQLIDLPNCECGIVVAEPPTEPPTELPMELSTDTPTETLMEPPTEPLTELVTEQPIELPTKLPTEPPTKPPTKPTAALTWQDALSTSTCSPLKVYAGGRHTVVLMSCGSLLATGWNAYGQLALGSNRPFIDSLTAIDADRDLDITCGAWCTIASKRNHV